MRASAFHLQTLKEDPADAEVASQRLMLRAGMIRRLGAGIYTLMPLGLRVLRKVETIIRDEMDRAGALEVSMPVVQPAELWQETGRWDKMGAELLRIQDRHGRDFVLQPTSEEVVTDLARQELRSWRQLPRNFYQIQTKFRDERRPRFGLMRGREFIMKDAYSFDRDVASAEASYDRMFETYCRIFDRLGLEYRAVAADTGAIGGSRSHEFQVIAETGEDAIVYAPQGSYAANIELAACLPPQGSRPAPGQAMVEVATPGTTACESVAALLGLPITAMVKSMVVRTQHPTQPLVMVLLRGDHTLNEVKLGKHPMVGPDWRMASAEEIASGLGAPVGYLGPVGMAGRCRILADDAVRILADVVVGANKPDAHWMGVNFGRDLPEPEAYADLRNAVAGDPSPDGHGHLAIQRGIEVGHVFYLGTKYSEAMGARFLNEAGQPTPMEMGCYGIGVSRILGAAIEQGHDERGMVWPASMAPFEVVICPMGAGRSPRVAEAADALYRQLRDAGMDVVLDDRDERPGAMFADWELIGVPARVVVGERGLDAGTYEVTARRGLQRSDPAAADIVSALFSILRA